MVKAIVEIDEDANRILNIVKAEENLKDKSGALNFILKLFGREMLEPELRSEFIKELLEAQNEKTVCVEDFYNRYK